MKSLLGRCMETGLFRNFLRLGCRSASACRLGVLLLQISVALSLLR